MLEDYFEAMKRVIPGNKRTQLLQAEEFLYLIYNYILYLKEVPLDYRILGEFYRVYMLDKDAFCSGTFAEFDIAYNNLINQLELQVYGP